MSPKEILSLALYKLDSFPTFSKLQVLAPHDILVLSLSKYILIASLSVPINTSSVFFFAFLILALIPTIVKPTTIDNTTIVASNSTKVNPFLFIIHLYQRNYIIY